jgi:endonuclease/exonuclease/phosphatase family metal-dependent hydrolase
MTHLKMRRKASPALCVLLAVLMLLPSLPVAVHADGGTTLDVSHMETVYKETFSGETTETLQAGNASPREDGLLPLNSVYDAAITPNGAATIKEYKVASKALTLLGNHSSETRSASTLSIIAATGKSVQGLITLFPAGSLSDTDEFTVSYIARVHKPAGGLLGLALFYDGGTEQDGVTYFGGYDNYAFAGYTGAMLNSGAAYTVYGGQQTDYKCADPTTKHVVSDAGYANDSLYTSVRCTKGEYEQDGKTYTAKIESYIDDQLISTSYAMWKDAPIMLLYKSEQSTQWAVQITDVTVSKRVTDSMTPDEAAELTRPLAVEGTSARYSGTPGLRIYTSLADNELTSAASEVSCGVLLLPEEDCGDTFDASTAGVTDIPAEKVSSDETGSTYRAQLLGEAASQAYMCRAYVRYTIGGQVYTHMTQPQRVSIARTAAKVVKKYADSEDAAMLEACAALGKSAPDIRAMSFNVLVSGTSTERTTELYGSLTYTERMDASIEMLLDLLPDVCGLSECRLVQYKYMTAKKKFTEVYGVIGSDEVSGTGEEGIYIAYRKERLELVRSEVRWLSPTPDVQGSLFPEAEEAMEQHPGESRFYSRKAVYALFRDKETGTEFVFCSTHLAYNACDTATGAVLRKKQAAVLIEQLNKLFPDMPYVIVGDMNCAPNSAPYNVYMESCVDARYTAAVTAPAERGTFHKFAKNPSATILDHIFIRSDSAYCSKYDIVTTEYPTKKKSKTILPSDHYAIYADVTILP